MKTANLILTLLSWLIFTSSCKKELKVNANENSFGTIIGDGNPHTIGEVIQMDDDQYLVCGTVASMDPIEDAILIRLNNNFIPEIIKIVDNRRIAFANSLLARYKNEILCVGPSKWNGQNGCSFIKKAMDGKIRG